MTAAHCYQTRGSTTVKPITGQFVYSANTTNQLFSTTNRWAVQQIIIHPTWSNVNEQNKIDIALLRVEPITFTSTIQPVTLASPSNTNLYQSNVATFASGFGATTSNAEDPSPNLKAVQLPFTNQQTCDTEVDNAFTSVICAGGIAGQDSCNGDSGGPLVVNMGNTPVEIGIVVSTTGTGSTQCGGAGEYGVYTNVATLRSWIDSHVAGLPTYTGTANVPTFSPSGTPTNSPTNSPSTPTNSPSTPTNSPSTPTNSPNSPTTSSSSSLLFTFSLFFVCLVFCFIF